MRTNSSGIRKYRIGVRVVQAIWVAVLVVQVVLGETGLVLAVGAVYIAGITSTYFIGRIRFGSLLGKYALIKQINKEFIESMDIGNKSDSQYSYLLRLVRYTSSAVLFFGTGGLIVVVALVVIILIGWKEFSEPGNVSPYPILLTSINIFSTGLLASLLFYVHRTYKSKIEYLHKSMGLQGAQTSKATSSSKVELSTSV